MSIALEVMLPPFVACLILTGIHTYLGLHVVSRGVIFVDLALAQIAALGATFAFLLGYDPHGGTGYLYSLSFAFVGAAVFSISRLRDQRVPQEAIIGITFAVASAGAILIADRAPQGAEFVEAMLTGALLWVPWPTILKTAVLYAGIGLFHWIYRRRFLTLSLDHNRAMAEGWNIRWWDFLFYLSFGFVITSSVAMAGILLVFSFLVIPSVIAMIFARDISARLMIGWATGTVVSMVGLVLSYTYDLPSGPAVVCTFGGVLVLAAVVRYIVTAERRAIALTRVGAGAFALVVALWVAFSTAVSPVASTVNINTETDVVDPARRTAEALATVAASEAEPPTEAVQVLLALGERFHSMMAADQIEVSEKVAQALSKSESSDVSELLVEIAYHGPDPWARLRAAQGLLARKNPLGVQPLVDLMDSDAPVLLKVQAVESLRTVTRVDFGYDADGPVEAQAEAIRQWRTWLDANKATLLPQ